MTKKSIPAILKCYPKMKIFFALRAKSPFLNIYNSNLLINQLFHNLIYIFYILLHMYTLFHHPIEELALQTS